MLFSQPKRVVCNPVSSVSHDGYRREISPLWPRVSPSPTLVSILWLRIPREQPVPPDKVCRSSRRKITPQFQQFQQTLGRPRQLFRSGQPVKRQYSVKPSCCIDMVFYPSSRNSGVFGAGLINPAINQSFMKSLPVGKRFAGLSRLADRTTLANPRKGTESSDRGESFL